LQYLPKTTVIFVYQKTVFSWFLCFVVLNKVGSKSGYRKTPKIMIRGCQKLAAFLNRTLIFIILSCYPFKIEINLKFGEW